MIGLRIIGWFFFAILIVLLVWGENYKAMSKRDDDCDS
jgi:hypothetical protein